MGKGVLRCIASEFSTCDRKFFFVLKNGWLCILFPSQTLRNFKDTVSNMWTLICQLLYTYELLSRVLVILTTAVGGMWLWWRETSSYGDYDTILNQRQAGEAQSGRIRQIALNCPAAFVIPIQYQLIGYPSMVGCVVQKRPITSRTTIVRCTNFIVLIDGVFILNDS